MDESQLRQIWQNRQPRRRATTLGDSLSVFMEDRLARRVRQIGRLAEVWDACIPDYIREHTALVTFNRGTLTVAVSSSPHRYQLRLLLNNGLEQAIRERFTGGALNRIRLVPGSYEYLELPQRRSESDA